MPLSILDVRTAVRAIQKGAVDFLEKPVDLDALEAAVARAAELGRMRREIAFLRTRDARATGAQLPITTSSVDRLVALAARNDDAPVRIG